MPTCALVNKTSHSHFHHYNQYHIRYIDDTMVPDDTRVRRRGSPSRRDSGLVAKQCDEVKEHCRNKKRVVRMFFLAPPVLLLVRLV